LDGVFDVARHRLKRRSVGAQEDSDTGHTYDAAGGGAGPACSSQMFRGWSQMLRRHEWL
jgi:hypothetical protein